MDRYYLCNMLDQFLSRRLFSLYYVNGLSSALFFSNVGCFIDNGSINNITYAADISILHLPLLVYKNYLIYVITIVKRSSFNPSAPTYIVFAPKLIVPDMISSSMLLKHSFDKP